MDKRKNVKLLPQLKRKGRKERKALYRLDPSRLNEKSAWRLYASTLRACFPIFLCFSCVCGPLRATDDASQSSASCARDMPTQKNGQPVTCIHLCIYTYGNCVDQFMQAVHTR